ncbi:hypothetical protein GCM10029978_067900 [Actinoallomurus acanthiterrae]
MAYENLGPNETINLGIGDIRNKHPSFDELARIDNRHADMQVADDVARWTRQALNVMRGPDAEERVGRRRTGQPLRPHLVTDMFSMETFNEFRGGAVQWRTALIIDAVRETWSLLNAVEHDLNLAEAVGYTPRIDVETHDAVFHRVLPKLARRVDEEGLVDRVTMCAISGLQLVEVYGNRLTIPSGPAESVTQDRQQRRGNWEGPPAALATLHSARSAKPTAEECSLFATRAAVQLARLADHRDAAPQLAPVLAEAVDREAEVLQRTVEQLTTAAGRVMRPHGNVRPARWLDARACSAWTDRLRFPVLKPAAAGPDAFR